MGYFFGLKSGSVILFLVSPAKVEVEKIFIPVAISKGIKLFTSEDSFLSFFNSPYYAHKNITAIDLYPRHREFGKPALCPVSGKVIETRNIKTPNPSKFEKSGKESLIIIRSNENPKICIKILHLLGGVKRGDHVEIGDEIGNYIRSGFFSYWTDPHIHIEVRPIKDAIRTRGGFEIKPIINLGQEDTIEELVNFNEVKGKIIVAKKDYLLIKIDKRLFCERGFFGLKAMIRNQTGILDCGIPHFGFGGVFLKSTSSLVKGDIVRVWGIPVGRVSHILNHQNYILFEALPFKIRLETDLVKGLALFLDLKDSNQIKIIPTEPKDIEWPSKKSVRIILLE